MFILFKFKKARTNFARALVQFAHTFNLLFVLSMLSSSPIIAKHAYGVLSMPGTVLIHMYTHTHTHSLNHFHYSLRTGWSLSPFTGEHIDVHTEVE